MAVQVQVAGLTTVKVDTGTSNALEVLGYTVNGAEVRVEAHFVDIPGDENGGDQGPPIDIQFMGERAIIRLELTKWDATVADKVACRLYGGTPGQPGAAGTLMFASSKTYRLLLDNTNSPMNFPRAIPRAAIEINKGTRYSRMIMEFEAHKDANGVLYDQTTT